MPRFQWPPPANLLARQPRLASYPQARLIILAIALALPQRQLCRVAGDVLMHAFSRSVENQISSQSAILLRALVVIVFATIIILPLLD